MFSTLVDAMDPASIRKAKSHAVKGVEYSVELAGQVNFRLLIALGQPQTLHGRRTARYILVQWLHKKNNPHRGLPQDSIYLPYALPSAP